MIITASLCEGPFLYIYVESPPFFEHHLIEHCCHSEYNVFCPKVLMIGACLRYFSILKTLNLVTV